MEDIEKMKIEIKLLKVMIRVLIGENSVTFAKVASLLKAEPPDHTVPAAYRNLLKQLFHTSGRKSLQDHGIGSVLSDDLLKEFEDDLFLGELTDN